jgi:hypothetical protein
MEPVDRTFGVHLFERLTALGAGRFSDPDTFEQMVLAKVVAKWGSSGWPRRLNIQERNIDNKGQLFEATIAFSSTSEVVCSA